MVNQYQDEKAQHVYTLIDKGRSMYMPFEGLSLLDYAINTSLALTNIILKKQDKAGIFTFSRKVEDRVVADRKSDQMEKIILTYKLFYLFALPYGTLYPLFLLDRAHSHSAGGFVCICFAMFSGFSLDFYYQKGDHSPAGIARKALQ